jgi:hypothetical protein
MAKQSTRKSNTLDTVIAQLEGLSINEILFAVSELNKDDQEGLAGFLQLRIISL